MMANSHARNYKTSSPPKIPLNSLVLAAKITEKAKTGHDAIIKKKKVHRDDTQCHAIGKTRRRRGRDEKLTL